MFWKEGISMGQGAGEQFRELAEKLDDSIKFELYQRGAQATKVLRNTELEVLSGSRGGKKYKRLPNRSSAPGEPPASQSGDLMEYWNEDTLVEGNRVISRIKSDTEYAKYLDEGTSRMAARPIKKPITEKAEPQIREIFNGPYVTFL